MQTVFERIPEYFVIRYDEELQAWGKNFKAIGPVKAIVLKEAPFADVSPNPEVGPVLKQVKLLARMERLAQRVTVCPHSDMDEMLIRKHCEKMVKNGVGPRQFTKEAPRLWIPGMPRIDRA
jgi:hypothetical protein